MANQQIDPSRILTPTQLLASVLVLLVVSVPAFITGAATTTSLDWVPEIFAIAAVADVPLTLLFVYRLLTKYRIAISSDEVYVQLMSRASRASRGLDESLTQAGVDTESLITGTASTDQRVRKSRAEVEHVMSALRDHAAETAVPPEAELNLAKAQMAEQQWPEAAELFDRYVGKVDADWEIHFLRGVSHANARSGPSSDLTALRAYNEAIALAPDDIEPNLVARLFDYRGAMAKRLGRYDQAEADLLLARRHATADYEITDITYNLAAVYAKEGRRDEALTELRRLRSLGATILVRKRLDDYFGALRDDPDFQEITGTSLGP